MQLYLDEDYLIRHIDEPINRAAARFRHHAADQVSHERFHQVLARFVAHLYGYGMPCSVRLSRSQARDEAVALLEQLYNGPHANGYFAAMLDARQGQPPGMEVVLDRMVEAIKLRARDAHLRLVFSAILDPADWELRREIANILLDRCRPWMAEHMAGCTGAQFADDIPALLMHSLSIDDPLHQLSLGM
jgi:hypothetical protein